MSKRKTMTIEVYHDRDLTIIAMDRPCCNWAENAIVPEYYRRRGKLVRYNEIYAYSIREGEFIWAWENGNEICWEPKWDDSYPTTVTCKFKTPMNFCPNCGARVVIKQVPDEDVKKVKKEREREKKIKNIEEALLE